MTENFKLEELTYSRAAIENGLENVPGVNEMRNLKALCKNLLQPLRDKLGAPIVVTSGYRSELVNLLVGGAKNSQHLRGEAADCYCTAGPEHLLSLLQASGLLFDQAILYRKKRFLHLSYREGFNRKQVVSK